jgi:hypothetical protein
VGATTGAIGRAIFGVVIGLFLLAFGLLWSALWPQRTLTTTLVLRALPGRSLAIGLLTTLLMALLLPPLVALLAATLIGLPLIVLLLICLQAPYMYGFAALAHALGGRRDMAARAGASLSRETIIATVAFSALVGVAAALMPLGGLALFYLAASAGLGAAILSRGGLVLPHVA